MVTRVAVIGNGAAGLCALRHLTARPTRFQAQGFGQSEKVGGTWVYTDKTGTDEYGLPVHSSMYRNLTTNLPKEAMAFPEYPFPKHLPSFVRHYDVVNYLESYADHYNINKHIKFGTSVGTVEPVKLATKLEWKVSYSPVSQPEKVETGTFDAVIVCNGHYAVPLIPKIPGLDEFKGSIIHSHNYRVPDWFKGQTVVCLGAGASGQDISLDLATVAKKVVISHNYPRLETPLPDNVSQQVGIYRLTEDGIVFKNGDQLQTDTLLLCTGYRYHYPFFTDKCEVNVDEERVTPLYKHIIHTKFPTLSIIGLCKTICPFPQFDNQIRFVLATLDGTLKLPTTEEMDQETEEDFASRVAAGMPKRHAHLMGPMQWDYNDSLAAMAKFKPISRAVQALFNEVHRTRVLDLPNFKRLRYELTGDDSFKIVNA